MFLALVGTVGFQWAQGVDWVYENGPVEVAQASFLALGSISLAVGAARRHALAPLLWIGSLLFLSLVVREVDIRQTNLPPQLIFLESDRGRHLWLNPLWALAIGNAWANRRSLVDQLRALPLCTAKGLFLLAAGVYVVSDLAGKGLWLTRADTRRLFEEMLEFVFAFDLMLFAAAVSRAKSPGHLGADRG